MNEAEAAEGMIRHYRGKSGDFAKYEFEPESHYNHYGDRGVVDLVVTQTEYINKEPSEDFEELSDKDITGRTVTLYEFKADAAIEEATGANEIIRQFQRHCNYYLRDSTNELHPQVWEVTFELCFIASETTWSHVQSNEATYRTVEEIDPYTKITGRNTRSQVTFRLPTEDNIMPVLVFRDSFPGSYIGNSNYAPVIDAMGL